MSQTETVLLVVLGFSLATLVALFFGRMVWTAALKLGARRMQKQVPSSLVGLQTERDRLRAEYAMLSQRLNTRLEATKLRMAEQMAEVSRHRNRIEAMEAAHAGREREAADLKKQVAGLQTELADAQAQRAELEQALAAKQAELDEALARIAAGLRAESAPVLDAFDDISSPEHDDRLRQRIGQLNALAQSVERDRNRPDISAGEATGLPAPRPADPLLAEKLGEAERETEDLEKELASLDAEWSKRLDELKEKEAGREGTPPVRGVANVISLANRIRDLKKGFNST